MNKVMGFMAGAVCGALVGAITALLLTPASGTELVQDIESRWELTKSEARLAMEERKRELETQFNIARRS